MDFFSQQDTARKQTKKLALLYLVSVVGLIAAISITLTAIILTSTDSHFTSNTSRGIHRGLQVFSAQGLPILTLIAVCTSLVIALGSIYKILALGKGGGAVALDLGGKPLDPNTADAQQRQLLNVVEEMAIASGVPVPTVYLLDEETGVNAFAAGYRPNDAVIGVTKGTLENLSRDELQGVIAHEFSHILNGDMRLNLRAIGILHGIIIVALAGRMMVRIMSDSRGSSRRSSKNDPRGVIVLVGLALMVLGYLGVLCARLIKSAISRQREFLADASAVQFTRNPQGIGGALRKILDLSSGSKIESNYAEEASHLFFANGLAESFVSLFATHPPLKERIRRIDARLMENAPEERRGNQATDDNAVASSFSSLSTREVVEKSIGTVSLAHIEQAKNFITGLNADIFQIAHEPYSARALVYALLLAKEPAERARQKELLAKFVPSDILEIVNDIERKLPVVDASNRFPLINLTLPALRLLSPSQREEFQTTARELIQQDRKVSFFEYVLLRVVFKSGTSAVSRKVPTIRSKVFPAQDASLVLSMLAQVGSNDSARVAEAFQAGSQRSTLVREARCVQVPESQLSLESLDLALDSLANTTPDVRKQIVEASLSVVLYDREVTPLEYELLQAIGSALDCPIPIASEALT